MVTTEKLLKIADQIADLTPRDRERLGRILVHEYSLETSFYLMAQADRYARQLGIDKEVVINEMKSGDYENLVAVFDRYFGNYVILER